jgi:hypothetical protein
MPVVVVVVVVGVFVLVITVLRIGGSPFLGRGETEFTWYIDHYLAYYTSPR